MTPPGDPCDGVRQESLPGESTEMPTRQETERAGVCPGLCEEIVW